MFNLRNSHYDTFTIYIWQTKHISLDFISSVVHSHKSINTSIFNLIVTVLIKFSNISTISLDTFASLIVNTITVCSWGLSTRLDESPRKFHGIYIKMHVKISTVARYSNYTVSPKGLRAEYGRFLSSHHRSGFRQMRVM